MFEKAIQFKERQIEEKAKQQAAHHKVADISINSLKSYCHYMLHEYQMTLIEYSNEEEQLKILDQKLQDIILKMDQEKSSLARQANTLERNKTTLASEIHANNLKNKGLGEQIVLLNEIQSCAHQKLDQIRKENLLLQTEYNSLLTINQDLEARQFNIGQKLTDKKLKIRALMRQNEEKMKVCFEAENRIEGIENESYQFLKRIQQNDEVIVEKSNKIEEQLQNQTKMLAYFEELKKQKNSFNGKIQEIKRDLSHQCQQTQTLLNYESQTQIELNQRRRQLQIEKKEIQHLKGKINEEKKNYKENSESLTQLSTYLNYLLRENQKIENQIYKTLEDDILIKQVIDKKMKGKHGSKWNSKKTKQSEKQLSNESLKIKGFGSTANSSRGFGVDFIEESD